MHKPLLPPLLASLLMTLAGASAQAQGVYRIVGPDGKVTFSDRPPADAPAQAARTTGAAPAAASGNASLPFELRQIATRFPVTIYTGNDCAPCTGLRNALVARGVPFTERTVTTSEDAAALQRLSGSTSLPFGSIGGQQLVGFSDGEWTQYLDAAGYPKQSQLPSSYRPPAATPLVAVKAVETAPTEEKPKAPTPSRPAPAARPAEGPTPSNPAGIRF